MASRSLPKRVAMAAAAFGMTAAVGTTPALAAGTPGENIFGSGSSLQKIAQLSVWVPKWEATPADRTQLSNVPTITYTSSSSGGGLAEFGNTTGALDETQDVTADNSATNGYGVPVLDGYVGTDDPPLGPLGTAGTQLTNASNAATGGATTAVDELTVPVAQAPVAILLSLPTGITAGTGTKFNLKNSVLQDVWNDAVPAKGTYAANTWGAFLELVGLKLVTGTPAANQFSDAGGSTGGGQAITLQVRSTASGTSYTFKGFLNASGDPLYTSAFVNDDDTWPVTTTNTGNTGGGALVADTTATPGSIGYANLADAATASPAYTNSAQTTTTGGTHQIAWALIQSNQGGTGFQYANPQGSAAGSANVYTGSNIKLNGVPANGVGNWIVPVNGTTFVPTGSWGGTLADDPDVYDHASKANLYPIVAATYDLAWTKYSEAGSNVVADYGGTTAKAKAAGNTAASFLKYIANGSKGQTDIANAHLYYAKLPTKIDTDAIAASNKIVP